MSNTTEAVTSSLMKMAMDGAALRHQAIAANIANATTPGFAPLHVSFEGRLQPARERLEAGESATGVAADLAPQIESDPAAGNGPAVAIDLQAAELAQNVVHYQALLKGYGKRMAILAAAINEGKR
jgi:flagellar basal-body rod protein FlgB